MQNKRHYYWCESSSENQIIPLSHLGYSLNKKDFITLLFKYDYDLNNTDYDNNTVLDIAMCDKNKEWIDYLFYMGANKYKKRIYTNKKRLSPLFLFLL